ncbi:2-dehydro-3-deoxygalactonokinase [Paraburkholderia silvatlantica]|uniref:2-dehydro-3-deoxygalactonokinase n=1 Tax=Paraburkholderia silvatlantica TaxID=321895 RepID=A0ABR6FTT1_9BURK|nr:2-dehydro-3-deoxygalactonokinase [Paraburkholderia silvatlantica]MBB2930828.1 2-dehydro-3-deoxygalactonokinase [Paraburkholderia silvatlantica]PVY31981.1 2-keto-3-deoxygalactonate kinase [Paraburkholderia silvatlantica]PXW37552.1 2-keto-3-deoxygalactonate kinase [Paraburkholderia silvatlantica]
MKAREKSASGAAIDAGDGASARDAALIALDWGTTSLRAYLFDAAGKVIATRVSTAGIMNLPVPAEEGGFDAAFDEACAVWLAQAPSLPVLAAGMVGSAQGWVQAPYVETPASARALVARIVRVRAACGAEVAVVPGVLEPGALPNVMRGEETQIFGALEASGDEAGPQTALVGLPGTHAKWVVVEGERIARFYTFMTGEVYAALCAHTILGRTMKHPVEPDTAAFLRGVSVAREQGCVGLLATAFSTRTLGLTAQLAPDEQPDYLSGLVIGHELAGLEAALARRDVALAGCAPQLIGAEALCERYRMALAAFGCSGAHLVRQATEHGLWRIAVQAGLVTPR